MKQFMTAMLVTLTAIAAMGQRNSIYIDDFEICPDSTLTLPVLLANGSETRGFQFNMTLPRGLELTGNDMTQYSVDYAMNLTTRYIEAGGWYTVIMYPSAPVCFPPDTVAVMTVDIKAASDFRGGEISFSKVRGSTIDNKSIVMDDHTTVVTVPESSLIGIPVDRHPVDERFFNMEGTPVSTAGDATVAVRVTRWNDGSWSSRKVALGR